MLGLGKGAPRFDSDAWQLHALDSSLCAVAQGYRLYRHNEKTKNSNSSLIVSRLCRCADGGSCEHACSFAGDGRVNKKMPRAGDASLNKKIRRASCGSTTQHDTTRGRENMLCLRSGSESNSEPWTCKLPGLVIGSAAKFQFPVGSDEGQVFACCVSPPRVCVAYLG